MTDQKISSRRKTSMHICIAPRERLTAAMEYVRAPHLVPIYGAVRDFGVGVLTVPQKSGPFAPFQKDVPVICLIGDDLHASLGPSAFDRNSLKAFVRTCGAAIVVSCEPVVKAYACAATEASVRRHNVVLVETRLQHEFAWVSLLRRINPRMGMLVATVDNKGAPHARNL
jgi:hypothetical protein